MKLETAYVSICEECCEPAQPFIRVGTMRSILLCHPCALKAVYAFRGELKTGVTYDAELYPGEPWEARAARWESKTSHGGPNVVDGYISEKDFCDRVHRALEQKHLVHPDRLPPEGGYKVLPDGTELQYRYTSPQKPEA